MAKTMTVGDVANLGAVRGNESVWSISITNLKVQASVGILKKEIDEKQIICINIRCNVLMPLPCDRASTHQVVCYDHLIKKIKAYFKKQHVYLLETAVSALLDICLEDERIQDVWVRVEKINLYDDVDRVGIEMNRSRVGKQV